MCARADVPETVGGCDDGGGVTATMGRDASMCAGGWTDGWRGAKVCVGWSVCVCVCARMGEDFVCVCDEQTGEDLIGFVN